MVDINFAFAKALKQLRSRTGLCQEDFAARTGLHRTYISQLERGLKTPSLETMLKIAKALQIDLVELVAEVERYLKEI